MSLLPPPHAPIGAMADDPVRWAAVAGHALGAVACLTIALVATATLVRTFASRSAFLAYLPVPLRRKAIKVYGAGWLVLMVVFFAGLSHVATIAVIFFRFYGLSATINLLGAGVAATCALHVTTCARRFWGNRP